jgi:hypothetical protein
MSRSTVYNNIVTGEEFSQVNKENIELLNEWVEYLQSTDKSPETIKQFIKDANIFFVWLLQNSNNKFFV